MRYILALVGCLLAFTLAQAQIYRFKVYSSSAGLRSNAVYSIYQDSKGYIWLGTDGGVCRYDGINYTTFALQQGLVDTSVYSIIEDTDGRLWFATKGGISCYDGNKFTNYTTAQGLPANETRSALRRHDGSLWFGTAKAVCRFDGTHFTSYGVAQGLPQGKTGLPLGPIWTLFEDRAGMLWVGMRGGGLAKFDGARFTPYGLAEGLPNDKIFGLAEDRNGGLWLATDGGLCYFNDRNGAHFRRYTSADGLSSELVSTVLVDKDNRVWCATFGGGINRLEQDRFTVFNRSNGLPDNYFMALMEDYEGNIWCGSRWSGACRFSNEMFANYTSTNGIGEGLITGIAESKDGTLWCSSINDGLSAINKNGVVRRYNVKDGMLEDGLWAVYIDSRNRIWLGGQKGVSCYEDGHFRNLTLEQLGARARITSIIEDRQGRIWFGSNSSTSDCLIVYDGEKMARYTTAQGIISTTVYTFTLDHTGQLWICTEGGLSRFEGEKFINYGISDGLPDRHVLCAYEDDEQRFWVGTGEGLCRFEGGKFSTYTTKDGLVNNVVRAITSRDNLLWIGTSQGLSAFDGKQFHNYSVRDGLISNEVTLGACLRRNDKSIWFGTNEGVVRYLPTRQMTRVLPPRIYLSALRTQDRDLKGSELGTTVSLAYNQNSIIFEFLGISFTDEAAIKYSYLLEGFDREWSSPSDGRSLRFTNLAPGQYKFMVKACSWAGLWSAPQAIAIVIRPPYWQTWWFRLVVLALIGALAYAGYAWRIRRLERRQEQRLTGLRQLLESIRVINSQLDLATVLQNITAESAQLVDGEPGGIGLIEGDGVVFERLWLKDRWENAHVRFRLSEGIAGQVAATCLPIIVNEPDNNPQVCFPELIKKYYVNGFMDVPIIDRRGKVVGVLDVRRRPGRAPFLESDRQLIESLAHQAAIAIENADLYGELAKQNLMIGESLHEIEKLYQNEQEVTRALQELNRMKNNFLLVTSHEMRTPLTVLKGYHEALLDNYFGSLSTPQRRSLATCQRTVDRLVASFNDILEMLKITEGRIALKPINLNLAEITREVVAELTTFVERREQNIEVEIADELPEIQADRDKVRLVLLNLIQNAIKFTPDGGKLEICLARESDAIHITVKDSGIGIEQTELEVIFDEFYTGLDVSHHTSGRFQFEARGSGLGLAVARGYVKAHDGDIWAESAGRGKGSCFHVLLPLAGAAIKKEFNHEAHKEQEVKI